MPQVFELHPDAFVPARPLFTGFPYDRAFMDAVFEGRQPGRLFVDNPDAPSGALMTRTYDYFLAGAATDALVQFLIDAPAEPDVFGKLYGYVPTNDAWLDVLRTAERLKLEEIPRRSFRLRPEEAKPHFSWQRDVPPHVTVRCIDKALAEQIDRELGETILLFWGSYDAFAEGGFGRVALIEGESASIAYTNVVSEREANISVMTAKRYRREGLAKLVCRAFAADAAERELDLTWDCDDANQASGALALRLGLTEEQRFMELGYYERRVPDLTHGLWSPQAISPSVTAWTKST